ncbi:MAG: hypothetical protein AB4080_03390 [Trichodesmium sp.]
MVLGRAAKTARNVCGAFPQEKGGNNYQSQPKFNLTHPIHRTLSTFAVLIFT